MNPLVAAGKPRLFEKPYTFSPTNNPAVLTCAPAPGSAVLVNLAPGPEETFRLILAPVEVLADLEEPRLAGLDSRLAAADRGRGGALPRTILAPRRHASQRAGDGRPSRSPACLRRVCGHRVLRRSMSGSGLGHRVLLAAATWHP